jgi:hypothetical protein
MKTPLTSQCEADASDPSKCVVSLTELFVFERVDPNRNRGDGET